MDSELNTLEVFRKKWPASKNPRLNPKAGWMVPKLDKIILLLITRKYDSLEFALSGAE